MPRRLRLAVAPLVLLIAALTACAEPTRLPPPEEPAARAPLFASDEEALAAATEAYEEYLAAVDAALAVPEQSPSVDQFATDSALSEFDQSLNEFRLQRYKLRGQRVVGSAELQQTYATVEGTSVVAYMCEDLSDVVLFDVNGESLTTPDRPNYTVFEVLIEFSQEQAWVAGREFWENRESC